MSVNKYTIEQTGLDCYPFNVKVHTSVDGGRTYHYAGVGQFFKTLDEALRYVYERDSGFFRGQETDIPRYKRP